jgi:hypothetical protein
MKRFLVLLVCGICVYIGAAYLVASSKGGDRFHEIKEGMTINRVEQILQDEGSDNIGSVFHLRVNYSKSGISVMYSGLPGRVVSVRRLDPPDPLESFWPVFFGWSLLAVVLAIVWPKKAAEGIETPA